MAAAQGFTGVDQARHVAAAKRFRLPCVKLPHVYPAHSNSYWDASADISLPSIVTEQKEATVLTPSGPQCIRNPLYSYYFHPDAIEHLGDGNENEAIVGIDYFRKLAR